MMVIRKIILSVLFLVLCAAPALSYAAGCCCLKDVQEKTMTMPDNDMPPCHQMDDQAQDTSSNLCLCDAGLLTLSLSNNQTALEQPVFYKKTYEINSHNPYVSRTPDRLLRPPITTS